MAQIIYSALVDKIRGSIGNVTFSHARSGEFIRYRRRPRDPRTAEQGQYRFWFTAAVAHWRDTMSDAQRAVWNTLGDNTTLYNSAGDPYNPSGLNLAAGINSFFPMCGQAKIATAPAAARWATPVIAPGPNAVTELKFTDTTGWSDPETGWVFVRQSPPQPATRYEYTGPWDLDEVHTIAEFHAGAPVAMTFGAAWLEGKRYFWTAKAIKTLGSLSYETIFSAIITP